MAVHVASQIQLFNVLLLSTRIHYHFAKFLLHDVHPHGKLDEYDFHDDVCVFTAEIFSIDVCIFIGKKINDSGMLGVW